MSTDGQGTKWHRNIAENFNWLSRAHERYRRQMDGWQHIANVSMSSLKSNDSNLTTGINKVINTVTLNHRWILSEARGGIYCFPKYFLDFFELHSYNRDTICITEKSHKILHGRFVHADKTLTDLQILGCELHQNAYEYIKTRRCRAAVKFQLGSTQRETTE